MSLQAVFLVSVLYLFNRFFIFFTNIFYTLPIDRFSTSAFLWNKIYLTEK